jgi:flagellar assembly protein FliH
LHPDDFAYISAHKERLEAGHALELVEDRSIGRGGCLVHTEVGDVDTRIEQQFAEIERAFLEL